MNKLRKRRFLRKLKHHLESPAMALILGIILLSAGLLEIIETMLEEVLGHEVGVLHAIVVLGIYHVLLSLVHLIEGIGNIGAAVEQKRYEHEIEKRIAEKYILDHQEHIRKYYLENVQSGQN